MFGVKQGWFMPITLLAFGLALAGLWGYVKYSESAEDPRAQSIARRDALSDPELTALVERDLRSRIFLPPPETLHKFSRNPAQDASGSATAASTTALKEISITLSPETTPNDVERQPPRNRVIRRWIADSKSAVANVALRMDEEAVRLRSNLGGTTVARHYEGWSRLNDGAPDLAIDTFNRILYREPENLSALSGKAQALMAMRRYTEALATYQVYLKLRPGDADAWYTRGVMLTRASRYGEAADHFRKAVQLNPKHAKAWYNVASVAQRDGRLSEAREAWETFTALEPSIASGWYNLGAVYMDYMKPYDAARCFSYVVMIDPTDVDGYVNLAEAYKATGDYVAALSILRQADELSPCDPVVMSVMAETHRGMASLYEESEAEHLLAAKELDEMAGAAAWMATEQVAVDDDEP